MKITSPALRARLARQVAETTGLEVQCGSARAVLPVDQRDQFKP